MKSSTPRPRFLTLWLLCCGMALSCAGGLLAAPAEPDAPKAPVKPALPGPISSADPIDRNHHLGPGDVVEITVRGLEELSRVVRLFRDGTFDYPVLKSVPAAGLTVTELARKLTDGLSQELRKQAVTVTLVSVYVPPPPVEVKAPPVPKITVLGAVTKKGIVELPEPRPLRTLLAEIGPTERADLAQIRVRYPDGSARTADFSKFNATGEAKDDFLVKGGEELIVLELPLPPKPEEKKTEYVRIAGQVVNPSQYELKPGMTLEDLIIAAGKLTTRADVEHIDLRRGQGAIRSVDLRAQQQMGLAGQVRLQGGDEVFVNEAKNTVIVVGAIPRPGPVSLKPGQRVREFFLQGDPELAAALNPAQVNLTDVQLIRQGQQAVRVNLSDVLKGKAEGQNLALESGDVLFIPPKKERGPKRSPLDYLGSLGFLFGLF